MQAKTKRWMKRGLIGGALTLVLGAGLTVYLLQRPPAVWRAAQATLDEKDPAQREAILADVMKRLSTAADRLASDSDPVFGLSLGGDPDDLSKTLSEQFVDETFQIELTSGELLAVASEWATKWVEQRGYQPPDQMGQPLVVLDAGELYLAFEMSAGSWNQVFSGRVELRFDPDGMAHGSVYDFKAGSLPLPLRSAGEWIAKRLPEGEKYRAEQIGAWVAELEDFEFRPVLELEHRRRARIVAMEMGEDSVRVTMRLQDHKTYRAHNGLMKSGSVAVTDALHPLVLQGGAIADVPTTTE